MKAQQIDNECTCGCGGDPAIHDPAALAPDDPARGDYADADDYADDYDDLAE